MIHSALKGPFTILRAAVNDRFRAESIWVYSRATQGFTLGW
jgi:hypothetical protein